MASIRLGAAANIRAFQALSNAINTSNSEYARLIEADALGDEFGRFRVWSGNLGALQKGHSSLDYRLRDSPLLTSNALKFLKELEENLSEALAIVSGARLPYEKQAKLEGNDHHDDDEDDGFFSEDEDDASDAGSPKTEVEMRFQEVVDIINDLYKLSVRIRTPTIRSRSLKASSYQPKDPETGVDVLEQYAIFDLQHTREFFRYLREPHKDDSSVDDDPLVGRLSKSITLRRRQFKYWRRHRDKLGLSVVLEDELPPAPPIMERPAMPPRHDTLEAQRGTPEVTMKEAPSQKTGKTMLSGTEATQHNKSLDDIVDSGTVTSYATTVHDLHGRGIDLPPPPKAADGDKDFECPYCFVICPSRYGKGRAWRTHILQDLQPYVCTYPDCERHEHLWRSRREWVEHEASHRKVWRCPEHPSAVYKSQSGLENHLRTKHADSLPESSLGSILKASETTTVDTREKCPICFAPADAENIGGLQNHIAHHLERLASFALPSNADDDTDGDSGIASMGRTSSGSVSLSDVSFQSDSSLGAAQISTVSSDPAAISDVHETLEDQDEVSGPGTHQLSMDALKGIPDSTQKRIDAFFYDDTKEDFAEEDDFDSAAADMEELLSKQDDFKSYMLSLPGAQSCKFFVRYGTCKGEVHFDSDTSVVRALETFDKTSYPGTTLRQGSSNKAALKFSLPRPKQAAKPLPVPDVKPDGDQEDQKSISSISLSYDEEDQKDRLPVLPISEIPTISKLYETGKLQQRDQSYAPNAAYNKIISLCFYDITRLKVDAVVNSANKSMKITRMNDSLNHYLHKAAGRELKRECKTAGPVKLGQVVVTSGCKLPATHVIHAARPNYYSTKGMGKFDLLAQCYRSALVEGIKNGFKTIAFPCLAAGGCGFPSRVAARTAIQKVRDFLDANPDHDFERIIFCVYSQVDEQAYKDFLPVYFPPSHRDTETAAKNLHSNNRTDLVTKLSESHALAEVLFHELEEYNKKMVGFPVKSLGELLSIFSATFSLQSCLSGPQKTIRNLQGRAVLDVELFCTVLQTLCGSVDEIIELAKESEQIGQPRHKAIWDDYESHMITSQGFNFVTFLGFCRDFIRALEEMIVRDGIEPYEMAILRVKLGDYRLKLTGKGDKGTRNLFDEVMYTREYQREVAAPHRTETIKVHQVRTIARLYQLGKLEYKQTNAIPSTDFNYTVCLLREDITKLEVDIIVNSTDYGFSGKGTLDRSVFRKGGLSMEEDCSTFGICNAGDVKMTAGYLLPAKHVLHAIPPQVYRKDTRDVLRKMYQEILHIASVLKATSIAIPAFGTGSLNYPRNDSTSIALEEVKRFLESADPGNTLEKIIFVVFGFSDELVYKSLIPMFFPPVDLNVNKALPASSGFNSSEKAPLRDLSSTPTTPPPRRSLFSSIGEAFRNVRFGKQPVTQTARPLNSSEDLALTEFENHARECPTCHNIAKLYAEGEHLCEEGYSLAQKVLQYLYMEVDRSVYSTTLERGLRVRVEIPTDYPRCWNLFIGVEKSLRDGHASRPFVSPNRPYSEVFKPPPGVNISNIEFTIPAPDGSEKTIAVVHTAFGVHECFLKVHPGKLEIFDLDPPADTTAPLLGLQLINHVVLEKHNNNDLTVYNAPNLKESQYKTRSPVRIQSRSSAENEALFLRLERARKENTEEVWFDTHGPSEPPISTLKDTRDGSGELDEQALSTNLSLLEKTFPTVQPELIRRVLRHFNNDFDEATDELLNQIRFGTVSSPDLLPRIAKESSTSSEMPQCSTCQGEGIVKCEGCNDKGCQSCASRGQITCTICEGTGVIHPDSLGGIPQGPEAGDKPLQAGLSLTQRLSTYLQTNPLPLSITKEALAEEFNTTTEEIEETLRTLNILETVDEKAHETMTSTSHKSPVDTYISLKREQEGPSSTRTRLDLSIAGLSNVNIDDFFTYLDLALDSSSKGPEKKSPTISRAQTFNTFTSSTPGITEQIVDDPGEDNDQLAQVHHPRPTTPDLSQPKPIPAGARWTKIDRRLVNPKALEEAGEKFEEREDCVIVLRVLSRDEIQQLAEKTREIRRGNADRAKVDLGL